MGPSIILPTFIFESQVVRRHVLEKTVRRTVDVVGDRSFDSHDGAISYLMCL